MNRPSALDAVEDYQTKATLGITGWLYLRVQIDDTVRHLDVGSTYPGGEEATKGLAVRQLKSYVSWVQTVQNLTPNLSQGKRNKRGGVMNSLNPHR